jgi:signal transduction histidine kinase
MTDRRFKQRAFTLGVVCTMAAVLGVLAVLQYRWSKQVSSANEAQIGANLQSLLMDWHSDFLREFMGPAVSLQVGPDAGARDNWADYLQRHREWEFTSSHADLVQNVYLWETSQVSGQRLFRLDIESSKLLPAAATPDLNPILERLQQNSSSLQLALRAWDKASQGAAATSTPALPGGRGDPLTGWQFVPSIPALVHPIVHHHLPADSTAPPSPQSIDWIMLVFDSNVLQRQVIPELVERYFAPSGSFEYKVAVVSQGEQARAIYSSDPQYGVSGERTADVVMGIFGPPPQSAEGHLWQTLRNGSQTLQKKDWRRFSGPVWFPIIHLSRDRDENWELILSHRRGSLQSMIAGIRYRNLSVSYGVLLMLGVSMSLVVLASMRAQKLARLQMDFVAAVSHELRTPLSVICSAADNLADGVVENQQQLARYGNVIRDQSRQLTELVEQILLFAATREDKQVYHIRPLKVADILDTALGNSAGLIEQSNFRVERWVEPGLPEVSGDLSALSVCLQNLIVNAIKYSEQNRWIGVRARRTSGPGQKDEIQISVQDRGMGIEDSVLRRIFEPFYRAPAVAEAQIHGTGLGLALAKNIAQAMGGDLTVVSQPGRGSTFTLHLPIAEPGTGDFSYAPSSETKLT